MPPALSPVQRTARPRNRLLAALPDDEFDRLRPHLRTMAPAPRDRLQRTHEPVRYVYFPNGGLYSVMTVLAGGTSVEAFAVGREGLIGLEAFLGPDAHALGDAVFQIPDAQATLERLEIGLFAREIERHGGLRQAVGTYARLLIADMVQSVACTAVHDLQQRACRWLLEAERRVGSSTFHVTQESLATLLGARRSTVTAIARDLQQRGLVHCGRGRITLLDHRGLESLACECYHTRRRAWDGWEAGRSPTEQ
jgi:CRP-like cAMP-binding protein